MGKSNAGQLKQSEELLCPHLPGDEHTSRVDWSTERFGSLLQSTTVEHRDPGTIAPPEYVKLSDFPTRPEMPVAKARVHRLHNHSFGEADLDSTVECVGPAQTLTFGRGRLGRHVDQSAWNIDYICISGAPNPQMDFVRAWMDVTQASAIRHPNLLSTLRIRHARLLEVTCAYTAGLSLDKVLSTMRLSPSVSMRIIRDVLNGLAALHAAADPTGAPRLHGDIRPANIIVGSDGISRLFGYGLSRLFDAPILVTQRIETAAYQSPEVLGQLELTPASDLFSVSAIMWECLTGQALFAGDTVEATEESVRSVEAPRIDQLIANVPRALTDTCAQLLAKEAGLRLPSAATALAALEGIVESHALVASHADVAKEVFLSEPLKYRNAAKTPWHDRSITTAPTDNYDHVRMADRSTVAKEPRRALLRSSAAHLQAVFFGGLLLVLMSIIGLLAAR